MKVRRRHGCYPLQLITGPQEPPSPPSLPRWLEMTGRSAKEALGLCTQGWDWALLCGSVALGQGPLPVHHLCFLEQRDKHPHEKNSLETVQCEALKDFLHRKEKRRSGLFNCQECAHILFYKHNSPLKITRASGSKKRFRSWDWERSRGAQPACVQKAKPHSENKRNTSEGLRPT